MSMSQEALDARRKYKREWAKKYREANPERMKKIEETYWEKKAQKLKEQKAE